MILTWSYKSALTSGESCNSLLGEFLFNTILCVKMLIILFNKLITV
ncbi:hypothetical protein SPWS13_0601 [Shewanella putrefaciens]|nr:hypothetical protein SPWS13_0601 [Shewanella putrefaciens]